MQLRQRVGMLDHDLGRERPRLDVAPLLELQQVAPVAEDGTLGQPLHDPLRHATSSGRVPSLRRGLAAIGRERATSGHEGSVGAMTGIEPATVVPSPTALETDTEPSSAASRSAIPCRPVP